MVEQGPSPDQYILVERTDQSNQIRQLWKGSVQDFKRRHRYLKTADVYAVVELNGVITRKLPVNLSRKYGIKLG